MSIATFPETIRRMAAQRVFFNKYFNHQLHFFEFIDLEFWFLKRGSLKEENITSDF